MGHENLTTCQNSQNNECKLLSSFSNIHKSLWNRNHGKTETSYKVHLNDAFQGRRKTGSLRNKWYKDFRNLEISAQTFSSRQTSTRDHLRKTLPNWGKQKRSQIIRTLSRMETFAGIPVVCADTQCKGPCGIRTRLLGMSPLGVKSYLLTKLTNLWQRDSGFGPR